MNTTKMKSEGKYRMLLLVASVFLISALSAQDVATERGTLKQPKTTGDYTYAIGVRAGGTSGLTGKYRMSSGNALEGILGFGPHWLGFTGLYELYAPAFNASGLNWYYGGGGHVVLQSDNIYWPENGPAGDRVGLGVDGIVGLEYKIPPIPIAVSLDLKPNMTVWTNGGIGWGIDPGLGVKVAW